MTTKPPWHASPTPLPSTSAWSGLATSGQLSHGSPTLSPSPSLNPSSIAPLQSLSTPSQTSIASGLIEASSSLQSPSATVKPSPSLSTSRFSFAEPGVAGPVVVVAPERSQSLPELVSVNG